MNEFYYNPKVAEQETIEEIKPVEEPTLPVIQEKRNYPKRVYREDAEKMAIVCLRDCAELSFITITRLLGHTDIHKRNIEYVYKANKDKFACKQVEHIKNKLKGLAVDNALPEVNETRV